MRSYAILTDAGFLKRKLGCQENPVTTEKSLEFVRAMQGHAELRSLRLHRIYHYHASPLRDFVKLPLGGTRMNFAEKPLAKHNTVLLYELVHAPFFSLSPGEVAFRGWKLNQVRLSEKTQTVSVTQDDLTPNVQQNGVDMRMGLDMAPLTLKRQVLVTGDSDVVPAMKFARREGVQLFLALLAHSIQDTLIEHSDLLLDIQPSRSGSESC